MEKMLELLRGYGQFLEQKYRLPRLREELLEAKYQTREAGVQTSAAKWELEKLEKGGFFRNLFGNPEDKKEKAWEKYRSAQAEERRAKELLDKTKAELAEAEQSFEKLQGSWEAYLVERGLCLKGLEEPQLLTAAEKPIIAAIGLEESSRCVDALLEARPWMRQDVQRKGVSYQNRKLEFLAIAREHTENLVKLLALLPEGKIDIPIYLRNPDGYILGVAMEYKQLDRLNGAIDQIRELRTRLKELA